MLYRRILPGAGNAVSYFLSNAVHPGFFIDAKNDRICGWIRMESGYIIDFLFKSVSATWCSVAPSSHNSQMIAARKCKRRSTR